MPHHPRSPRLWRIRPRAIVIVSVTLLFASLAFQAGGEIAPDAKAQSPMLVADLDHIAVDDSSLGRSEAQTPVVVDGVAYFRARTESLGWELWRSDGTAIGTYVVRDICPGPCSSSPHAFTVRDDAVFFAAKDGVFGVELWSSDGTRAGTRLVADVCPGPCDGMRLPSHVFSILRVHGDAVYFPGTEPSTGQELWTSDGTEQGTRRVADICPGPCDARPWTITVTPGLVYFQALTAINEWSLFATDGTEAGTVHLARTSSNPTPRALDDFILFTGYDDDAGLELWRSDGTPASTRRIADFCPGPCSSFARMTTVLNGAAYVAARPDPAMGADRFYYRTDGTPAGTRKVDFEARFSPLVEFRGDQYIDRFGGGGCHGLWRTDFTTMGTQLVFCTSRSVRHATPLSDDSLAFFEIGTLRTTEGTPESVNEVYSFQQFPAFSTRIDSNGADSTLLIGVDDGTHGAEPWISDGTTGGTRLLLDIGQDPGSSDPSALARAGDTLVFDARDAATPAIYTTNGTSVGTFELPVGPRDTAGMFAGEGVVFPSGGLVYSGIDREGLWQTDGTAAGTLSIAPQPYDAQRFTRIGNRVFFAANSLSSIFSTGLEPWVTDGTEAGTYMIADLVTAYGRALSHNPPSNPRDFVGAGDDVLFLADDDLWRTDGSEVGTLRVPRPDDETRTVPASLIAVAGRAVFAAGSADAGRELWTTDGTAPGTRLLRDVVPGSGSSDPGPFVEAGGRIVLFFAANADRSQALWVTDGTEDGTRKLLDVGDETGFVTEATRVGKRLFFTLATVARGPELWTSDTTQAGTFALDEIIPGPVGSHPHALTVIDDTLVFAASDLAHGDELWMLDDDLTSRRLTDLADGPLPSAPADMIRIGDRLYFSAFSDDAGRELWSLPWPLSPPIRSRHEPMAKSTKLSTFAPRQDVRP